MGPKMEPCGTPQGHIQQGFDTSQPLWGPKVLSQISKKLKIS